MTYLNVISNVYVIASEAKQAPHDYAEIASHSHPKGCEARKD